MCVLKKCSSKIQHKQRKVIKKNIGSRYEKKCIGAVEGRDQFFQKEELPLSQGGSSLRGGRRRKKRSKRKG